MLCVFIIFARQSFDEKLMKTLKVQVSVGIQIYSVMLIFQVDKLLKKILRCVEVVLLKIIILCTLHAARLHVCKIEL